MAAIDIDALLLRAVLNTVGEAIITINAEGMILMINREAQRIWGYSDEELLGQQLEILLPPHFRERHAAGMRRYLQTRVPTVLGHRMELEGLRRDGTIFPLELRIEETMIGSELLFTAAVRDLTSYRGAQQRLAVQYTVTRILAEEGTITGALPSILGAISEALGWDVAAFWDVDPETLAMSCAAVWHSADPELQPFVEHTQMFQFRPGIGLPGRVLERGQPLWIIDVVHDTDFPRAASAMLSGLHSAIGFPVPGNDKTLGVMEFFTVRQLEVDPAMMAMMSALGTQVGQWLVRLAAERELRIYKDQLEGQVELRTAELQQANQQLRGLAEELREKNAHLQQGLELAREIQLGLLPATAPWDPARLEIASRSLPAYEVGGDFYSYVALGESRAAVIIGDISGKGVGAALMMALVVSVIEQRLHTLSGPGELLEALNQHLYQRLQYNRMNAAVMVLLIDLEAGALTVSNAGMIAPLLIRAGSPAYVDAVGLPLGSLLDTRYAEAQVALLPGDTVLLMSDGVVEARNGAGQLFGFERVEQLIASRPSWAEPHLLLRELLAEVRAFCAGVEFHDDLTLVALAPHLRR